MYEIASEKLKIEKNIERNAGHPFLIGVKSIGKWPRVLVLIA